MSRDFLIQYSTPIALTSADTPHTASLYRTYTVNCTGSAVTSALPTTPTANARITYFKTDASANALTITVNGGALIEGISRVILTSQGQTVTFIGDGALWHIENCSPGANIPTTMTVGAGKDFATIQAAWNWLKGKVLTSAVTIVVDAGIYTESVMLSGQPYADLITIQGDIRTASGQHFATSGNIVSAGGNNYSVTLVGALPADYTVADYIEIGGCTTVANNGRFSFVSIVGQVLTYTNAAGVAEAVLSDTRVIFCPNRIIDSSTTGLLYGVNSRCGNSPTVIGFTLLSTTASASAIVAEYNGQINCNRIAAFNLNYYGFYIKDSGGSIITDANCTAISCNRGFILGGVGSLYCVGTYAANCTKMSSSGFWTGHDGYILADSSKSTYITNNGYYAENKGTIHCNAATAQNCNIGYLADWNSYLYALNTNANNSGNVTNYTPATSGTEGATDGIIQWS